LDFNGQDIKGLGSLSYDAQRGMYLHPTYAITPQREPLGVTAMWMWARERRDESQQKAAIEKDEAKESIRWIKG
jgi:hypothetical protein